MLAWDRATFEAVERHVSAARAREQLDAVQVAHPKDVSKLARDLERAARAADPPGPVYDPPDVVRAKMRALYRGQRG